MGSKFLAVTVAATSLFMAATRAQAASACQLGKLVEIPVTMQGFRPYVKASINGKEATFLVDTGAFFSMVTDDAIDKFGMRHISAPLGLQVKVAGGATREARAAVAENFSFAGANFKNIEFLAGGRLDLATAGLIGENLIGPFDVEFDLANGVIRFFSAKNCANSNLAYWSADKVWSRLDLDAPGKVLNTVVANARVDGHLIRVKFDSGAGLSVMSRTAAARAGIAPSSEGVDSAGVFYGAYGKGQEVFLAPFASFKIGDEEIKNTKLRVGDIAIPDSDMLLGADFFLSHRIMISGSQRRIYFTYNGGPVFRFDARPAPPQTLAAATPVQEPQGSASQAGGEADQPKTGGDFQRRGQAFVSRGKSAQAIADFTKAIELEPNDASHYHARALARLAARQPVLAMADLDEALKLNPSDAAAFIVRGQLYLGRDASHAKADFDQALKLSPDDAQAELQIGYAYARAGMFDPAMQQYDTWIAAHPKDDRMPQILSARCEARALANRDLDKALADCDAALRGDKVSTVMEHRGLVLLRMGRIDEAIAQYTAAIRLQPRAAQAFYCRGLAELKNGMKAQGDADIAAALAIAPAIAADYKRFGLSADAAPAEAPPAAKS